MNDKDCIITYGDFLFGTRIKFSDFGYNGGRATIEMLTGIEYTFVAKGHDWMQMGQRVSIPHTANSATITFGLKYCEERDPVYAWRVTSRKTLSIESIIIQ